MTLSKEKLAHYAMHTDGSVKAMARELLERRGRDKQEPDGWQFLGVNGLWVSVTENGMREALKEGCEVRPLYAVPQLPQPAVVVSDEMIDTFEAEFRRAFEVSSGVEQMLEIGYQGEKFSLSIRDAATWWKLGRAAMLQGAEPVIQPDAIDANLVEALRLVQCMLEDYREQNYGDAKRWIRHINTHMSDYSESHGDDAYSVLHDLLPAAPQQEVK